MHEDVLGHMAYQISNAPIRLFPFPHIFVENVFPDAYYEPIRLSMPNEAVYSGFEAKYKGRKFNDTTELPIFDPMRTQEWLNLACVPFKKLIAESLGTTFKCATDLRLVMDAEGYSIGPHTDAKHKILAYLFYLPPNRALEDHGTSIYLPRDPTLTCEGGPHYKYEPFTRIFTAPFIPNSLFAFFKTNKSFHGVEPITIPCRRDVLLWNLYKG